jgi:hypothetical protein
MSSKRFNEKTATLGISKGSMGESMVKYTKKVVKNNQVKKEVVFMKTQESKFKFYLNFILKLLIPQLGLL